MTTNNQNAFSALDVMKVVHLRRERQIAVDKDVATAIARASNITKLGWACAVNCYAQLKDQTQD